MRLTSEWGAKTDELQQALTEASHPERLEDNGLHHFCIFSDNVLAVSVVVRSTIEVSACRLREEELARSAGGPSLLQQVSGSRVACLVDSLGELL